MGMSPLLVTVGIGTRARLGVQSRPPARQKLLFSHVNSTPHLTSCRSGLYGPGGPSALFSGTPIHPNAINQISRTKYHLFHAPFSSGIMTHRIASRTSISLRPEPATYRRLKQILRCQERKWPAPAIDSTQSSSGYIPLGPAVYRPITNRHARLRSHPSLEHLCRW
ncbi:hypothetical protein Mapa_005500 [Marchantia paleacea]|nr:hypothetical protein Mapa_005500 [Marchantia paleacea]